jgi:hypothetical protein
MESNVLYIEPTMKDIVMYRKLIKSQGNDVCQNEIDIYTINETIHSFTFGFIIISTKAQIGRRNLNKNDLFLIDGFIFCSHNNMLNNVRIINLHITVPKIFYMCKNIKHL